MAKTEKDRQQLEDIAARIQDSHRDDADPIVVEFAGSPKSGKTTNIDIICHFFKRMKFRVWAPTEGASKRTPYHLKRDLVAFNTWSLNYAISELLVAYYNVEKHDLIILDRGPFDSLAWMNLLKNRGELTPDELRKIEDFALHPKWSQLVSRVCLFKCDPKVSLKRELETKLTHGPGTAMNEGMLGDLLGQYEALGTRLTDDRLRPYDTSKTSGPLETAEPIVRDILSIMEAGDVSHSNASGTA